MWLQARFPAPRLRLYAITPQLSIHSEEKKPKQTSIRALKKESISPLTLSVYDFQM